MSEKKMNLTQVIYLISVIRNQLDKSLNKLSDGYILPLSLNGKLLDNTEVSKEMLEELAQISAYEKDFLHLKNILTSENSKVNDSGYTLFHLIELVKFKREKRAKIEFALRDGKTIAESGVGLIAYGVLNKALLKEAYETLSKEINQLSNQIDMLNSNTFVEVNLSLDY